MPAKKRKSTSKKKVGKKATKKRKVAKKATKAKKNGRKKRGRPAKKK